MTSGELAALREELTGFRRQVNGEIEFGGLEADHLEARVEALEEVLIRHWPARRIALARLRRTVRAGMKHVADPGPTWRTRREQAAHLDFHAWLDEHRPDAVRGFR